MLTIDLQPIPNQRIQFAGDGQQYDIDLRTIDDVTYMDVSMNGTVLISSAPCIPQQLIVPYAYLEGAGGNFVFETMNDNYPNYKNFGAGDVLLYATNAELATLRGA